MPGRVWLRPLQHLEEGGQAGPLERGGTEASELSGTASTLCNACRGWGGRGPWGALPGECCEVTGNVDTWEAQHFGCSTNMILILIIFTLTNKLTFLHVPHWCNSTIICNQNPALKFLVDSYSCVFSNRDLCNFWCFKTGCAKKLIDPCWERRPVTKYVKRLDQGF